MRIAGILIVLGFLSAVGSCGTKPGDTASPGQAETGSVTDDETIPASETTGRKPSPDEKRLHNAAKAGDIETVKALLAQGVDINAKNVFAYTPLYDAIRTDQVEVARLLIAKGADVNAKNKQGSTPLHWTIADTEMGEFLIAKGADVDAKTVEGKTPLKVCAERCPYDKPERHLAFARMLIAHGADVNARGPGGAPPIRWPQSRAMTLLLAENGSDLSWAGPWGRTVLHWAASSLDAELAGVLLSHGADVNVKDEDGWTPLDCALRDKAIERGVVMCRPAPDKDAPAKRERIVKLLLEAGADVNTRDGTDTPLLVRLAKAGGRNIVELLVLHGADVNAKDADGRTALSVAEERKDKDLAAFLRKAGAKE